ncbi:MAG TPA: winged helix-turn-helix domain-containing protein [Thermomicrobiales bacterium]|nr:winged helix-turn-helix domain-containing protein [Thermomicrobiales bacterium]
MKRPLVCFVAVESRIGRQVRGDLAPSPWRLKQYTPDAAEGCKLLPADITLLAAPALDAETLGLIVKLSGPEFPPVLVIAPDEEPRSIADALSSGATDVARYPFAREELTARVESILRRQQWNDADQERPLLVLDSAAQSLAIGGRQVTLPRREWDVLQTLIEYGGSPVPPDRLEQASDDRQLSRSTVIATISRLRGRLRQLGVAGIYVHTIPGKGYQLELSLPVQELNTDGTEHPAPPPDDGCGPSVAI